MTQPQLEIQLIAAVTAAACALPGAFLVLRRMAMMSDAIGHSILLGIVLAFFAVGDLSSPLLVLGAAATGVATVGGVELLHRTGRVKEDAAIGLVFPLLFSLGVILVSRYAGNVHLDVDSVLLGEIAFAPFTRLEALGYDLGPKGLWTMGGILALNLLLLGIFRKELALSTFDPALAGALGFSPAAIHYGLMSCVSVTAVGAFDAVGSILVVALMVAPPSAAWMLSDRLPRMLSLSCLFGVGAALSGYWAAHFLDASIAGSIASVCGAIFAAAFLLAPDRGYLASVLRRRRQRLEFARTLLLVHLYHHEGLAEEGRENRMESLVAHLRWERSFAERIVASGLREELLLETDGLLSLTPEGRERAAQAMAGG